MQAYEVRKILIYTPSSSCRYKIVNDTWVCHLGSKCWLPFSSEKPTSD